MSKRKTGLLALLLVFFVSIVLTACSTQTENVPQTASLQTEVAPQETVLQTKEPAQATAPPEETVSQESIAAKETTNDMGAKSYEYLKYIDANLPDRDCVDGTNYAASLQWIKSELIKSGYSENDIHIDEYTFHNESAEGQTIEIAAQNIWVTKKGTSGKQIIIGTHFDGTGTGDNGSGAALALAAATAYSNVDTYYDLTFVFFSGEEYGLYGSAAYADSMSEQQIANTQYMLNMDSIICGDYCHIYGGVADFETRTVTQTEAYDNAFALSKTLGLAIRTNPWTFENPEPSAKDGVPAYPSPSTADCSDHVAFRDLGIPYLYFEATNWEVGNYDGYEETASFGPIMNTENDYLEKIESLFPGRAEENLNTFAALFAPLLAQSDLQF